MATKSRTKPSAEGSKTAAVPRSQEPDTAEQSGEQSQGLSPFEQALIGAIQRTRRKPAERDEAA
jgi:hypothetical protein